MAGERAPEAGQPFARAGGFDDSTPPRPASQAQLLNISTRLRVETGDKVLIGGFIVTGNVAKKVILRAIGPSLTQAGVAGALADLVLEFMRRTGA